VSHRQPCCIHRDPLAIGAIDPECDPGGASRAAVSGAVFTHTYQCPTLKTALALQTLVNGGAITAKPGKFETPRDQRADVWLEP
jgi:hypothetical protein